MTYEQYLHASPEELTAVKEAQIVKFDLRNQELWLQGLYIYDAVGVIIANTLSKGKKQRYSDKPIDIWAVKDEKDAQREAQEKITARLQALQADWQRRYGSQNK